MSGIYGMVRYDGAPVTRETLAPIAAALSFYGPDGHGQWCGDAVGLGHLMLHVTPESLHERLPASIRVAPHLVITADARIDNRDELFDSLGAPRQGRDQTPDSSLILLAWEKWGAKSVRRLLGDFAFAIWDSRQRALFCARDPFGCKPFLYHYDGKRFVFASDVTGVLARVESPRLNEPLLAAYLQMNTCHAESTLTFFEGIVKLPPAHLLTLTASGVEVSRYWSPEDAPQLPVSTAVEFAKQLEFLFRQAVGCRVRSAFPVGAHLSGGLDSSAVSVAASRALGERGRELAVFSWSPPPDAANTARPEGEYARIEAVCRQEGLVCEYLPVTRASLIETFQKDFTVEPTMMMAREANVQARAQARQLRVILSGWGGDEAVTCRATTGPAEFLFDAQWAAFREAVATRVNTAGGNASPLLKARRVAGILRDLVVVRLPDSLYRGMVMDPFMTFRTPCPQAGFARLHRDEMKALRIPALRPLPDVRARICRLLEIGHVHLRMEHWAGSGARHGLEYRYPLLDKRLVEFVLGIPRSPFRETDRRRSLFRHAVCDLLPASIDWSPAKHEAATMTAVKTEQIHAHLDWFEHLASEMAGSPANRFVDPAKLRNAVRAAAKSHEIHALSGILKAFGCYAIRF